MAEDKTRFHFDFGGVKLELAGEREFVERMYQQVMKDVQVARQRAKLNIKSGPRKKMVKGNKKKPSVWVHRCSDMMRKIYMASRTDVMQSPLGEVLDASGFENIYMDREAFNHFFPELEGGYTLWAEFTTVGRRKIAEATSPKRVVLKK